MGTSPAAAPRSPRFDLPTIEDESRPFWDGARDGRLMLMACNACSTVYHYPRPVCPSCWSENVAWRSASGKGVVYTFSTVHVNDLPPFAGQVPYVAAMVDLEEGVRISTRLVDCAPEEVRIGMAVEVAFVPLTEDITLPVFRPCGS